MVWVGVGDFCFSFSGVAAVLGSWLGWSTKDVRLRLDL